VRLGDPLAAPVVAVAGTEARAEEVGHWELEVVRAGRYEMTVHVPGSKPGSRLHMRIGEASIEQPIQAGSEGLSLSLPAVRLKAGPARLQAWTESDGTSRGVLDVTVSRVGND